MLNVFNLSDKPEQKTVQFTMRDIGLPTGALTLDVPFTQDHDLVTFVVTPARRMGTSW